MAATPAMLPRDFSTVDRKARMALELRAASPSAPRANASRTSMRS